MNQAQTKQTNDKKHGHNIPKLKANSHQLIANTPVAEQKTTSISS